MKNVCQTCLLDLQYGLPVQVRDHFLDGGGPEVPQSDVSLEYMAQQNDKMVEQGLIKWGQKRADEAIKRLARTTPYYKRNRAHICSFFLKGECRRGDECPYRHEMPPEESELSHQNFHDRYYGVNDPVAKKMLGKAGTAPKPTAPDDRTITTLYVGGIVDERIEEADIRDKFYGFGEVASIKLAHKAHCAFVTYTSREAAEEAIEALFDSLVVKGLRLRVAWGRPQEVGDVRALPAGDAAPGEAAAFFTLPAPPGMTYAAPVGTALPGVGHYPSQDPRRLGGARAR
jgi:pre-mRNA-splicing factor RBM22/SLT11